MTTPSRGDLFWVNLDRVQGSEIAKTRPAAIISNDVGNTHSRGAAFEVFVPAGEGKMGRSVDKSRLGKRLGELEAETMLRVDRALHVSLALTCAP